MGSKDKENETKAERRKRLAAELRANLARRKAQARARRTGATDERGEGESGGQAGEAGEEQVGNSK